MASLTETLTATTSGVAFQPSADGPTATGMEQAQWTWHTALCGVVPPLISPLDERGEPDVAAAGGLVEHVIEQGCTGVFVLGGCGEGPWLAGAQRAAIVRTAVGAATYRRLSTATRS